MSSNDHLIIDTPEQMTLDLPLAGIGSRLLAFIFDSLVQFIVFLAATLAFAALTPARLFRWVPQWLAPVLLLLLWFCLYWGYFALFETLWKGQTPGKRYAGIRTIKETGRPINAVEAIGRNLMRAIDGLPGFYLVALISMIVSAQNRRLGDYVAGTVVVHDKKPEPVHADWTAETPAGAPSLPPEALISPSELLLVETFLERRSELPDNIRQVNAWQIAHQLSEKHGVPIPPGDSPEDFIEKLARQARDHARFT